MLSTQTFVREPLPPDPDNRPTLRTAVEGLVFIRRTPVLLAAIALDLFAVLFGGAVALIPVIAKDRLGVGDVAYGWLRAAPGFGAAAMALALAARPVRRHVGKTLLVVVGVFGVGTVVLGMTRNYVLAFLALVVLSAADMVSVFIRGSLVPLVTPDEKRGRVLAVESVFIGASNELGAFESGMVAQAFGTPATVIGGGRGDLGGRRHLVVRVPVVATTSTASRSSNVATRPSRSEGHQPGAALLMSLGNSPNDVSTDRMAALSTPVTSGVAAAVATFQIHRSLGPVQPVAAHRHHELLGVEPADRLCR